MNDRVRRTGPLAVFFLLFLGVLGAAEDGGIDVEVTVRKSGRPVSGARLGWSVGNTFPGLNCRSLDLQNPLTDSAGRGKLRLRCSLDLSGWYRIQDNPLIVTAAVSGAGNRTLAFESFATRRLDVSRRLTVDMDAAPAGRSGRLSRSLEAVKREPRGRPPKVKPTQIFVAGADLRDVTGLPAIALSPDGRKLAAAGRAALGLEWKVARYDVATRKQNPPMILARPTSVRYAGDSEGLFVISNGVLAEVRGRRVTHVLAGRAEDFSKEGAPGGSPHPEFVVGNSGGAMIVSPDGKRLLVTEIARNVDRRRSGSIDVRKDECLVYDAETGEEVSGVLSGPGPKGEARFSRDGSRLASYRPGLGDGFPPVLEIWDTSKEPWKKLRVIEVENIFPAAPPSFSADGVFVAGGGRVFEVETGRVVHELDFEEALFDPLNRFLMTWNSNGRGVSFLRIGDWGKFDELTLEQGAGRNSFGALEISTDGRTLAGVVNVWQGRRLSGSYIRIYTRGETARPTAGAGQ